MAINKKLNELVKANYKMIKEYSYEKNGVQLNFSLNVKDKDGLQNFLDILTEASKEVAVDIKNLG